MSESPAKKRKEGGGGYSHYNQGPPPSSSPYGHPPPQYGYHHSRPPPTHLSHHGQPPQQQYHRQQYDGPPPHHYSQSMLYSKGPPPHSHPNHPSNYQQSSSLYSTQLWTGPPSAPPQSQPNSGNNDFNNDSRRSIDHINGMIKDDGGRYGSGNNFDKDKSSPTSKSSPSKQTTSTGINTGGGNGYYANKWHGSSPAGGPPDRRSSGGLSYNSNAPPPPIWNTSSSPPHWNDRDFSGSGGRSSPRESAESNDKDDGKGGDKGRGSYKCGKCGVPKKGHVCPYQPKFKRRPDEPPPEMKNASTQVEMDEFLVLRRLNLEIQGFPESYTSEPVSNVGAEPHSHPPLVAPSPPPQPPLGQGIIRTAMMGVGGHPPAHSVPAGKVTGPPPPSQHPSSSTTSADKNI